MCKNVNVFRITAIRLEKYWLNLIFTIISIAYEL